MLPFTSHSNNGQIVYKQAAWQAQSLRARKNMCFTVIHFAGPVSYDGTNFMVHHRGSVGNLLAEGPPQRGSSLLS